MTPDKFNDQKEQLRGFMESTGAEIREFNELTKSSDSPVLRRIRCRIIFSCIESSISQLKQSALLFAPNEFTPEERLALSDEETHVTDNGLVKTRKAKIGLKPNLRLAFKAYAKARQSTHMPDFSGADYQQFQKAVKIRDRLTHPKCKEDLEVTDQDNETVTAAWIWFTKHLAESGE